MRKHRRILRFSTLVVALALAAVTPPLEAKSELKGAAILDHACGKLAVKHMGLVHAGKMEEAVNLGTHEMQAEWQAMPEEDRKMMSGMMQELSQSEEQFTADVKASGVLTVEEKSATLEIVKETKDESGTSKETWTQKYVLDGDTCRISR